MDYIVLDLEWNQSSEAKNKSERELIFEIIEIGAMKYNQNRKQIDSFHEIIRPQVFHEMHQITSDLIHLKMEDLQNGRSFVEVMKDFLSWCGNDYIFCTWGSLDLLELQRNMAYYHMEPLAMGPLKYFDIQKLFSIAYEDRKSRRTLEYAINFLELEKDIPFHRADADAYYTGKILSHFYNPAIFDNYSFDVYHLPRNREEEVHAIFDDYEKYISKEFPDKTQAMADREVTATRCYLCGSNVKRKIPWFSGNGKHYYTIASCEKHGYIKGKIRLRKSTNNHIYVVKTLKFINEESVNEILKKQEKAKNQRKTKRKSSDDETKNS